MAKIDATDTAPSADEAPAVKVVEVRLLGFYVPADSIPAPGGTFDKLEPGTIVSLPTAEAVPLLKGGVAELTEDAYANLGK